MKQKLQTHILLFIVLLVIGCTKAPNISQGNINFTVGSLSNTKTVYDPNDKWQINWIENDQISIFCDQAKGEGNKQKAAYKVTPNKTTPNIGTLSIAESDGIGLRWGDDIPHNLYAVYPSIEVSQNNIKKESTEGVFTFNFPSEQTCSKSGVSLVGGNYMLIPYMNLAYMVSRREGLTPTKNVELLFKPISTTLEITFRGATNSDVEISSLELTLNTKEKYIKKSSNNYQVQFNAKQNYPLLVSNSLTPYTTGSVSTATFIVKVDGDGKVLLKANESVTFTVFLPPIEKLDDLKVKCLGSGGEDLGKLQVLTTIDYAKSADKRLIKLPPAVVGPDWDYILDVTAQNSFSYDYYGGTKSYTVKSYRVDKITGKTEPVKWEALFSPAGGTTFNSTRPAWLTSFTATGAGSTSGETYNATVIAEIGAGNTHRDNLNQAQQKGSKNSPYNLSSDDGTPAVKNTANCYVVNAPGWYSIPLVYGNAIKNYLPNTQSYTSTATGANILSTFINHTGNGITGPYIKDNQGCTPNKAELVWQDAPSLVTEIKYNSAGNGKIEFYVSPLSIQQGNAVIAIKNAEDNVLWSWHIWVTDENIDNTITEINNNARYDFMPVNLGWCDAGTTTYLADSYNVKFRVKESGVEKSIDKTISRKAGSITHYGNYPFYQLYRKDPLFPAAGMVAGIYGGLIEGQPNKAWYNKDGVMSVTNPNVETISTTIDDMIKKSILNPNVMYSTNHKFYFNLWSVNNNVYTYDDKLVVKTIYDPCPIGYSVPEPGAFSRWTGRGGWNNGGSYFKTSTGETLFLFAGGFRLSNGILGHYKHCVEYMTAEPGSNNGRVYRMSFNVEGNFELKPSVDDRGSTIRPVKEKQ